MLTVPFQLWHLTELELGAEEQLQYAGMGSEMFGALASYDGPAWSLLGDHGRILGCFGMVIQGRDGILWAVLSDEARANPFGLHRAAKRRLALVESLVSLDRILAAVRTRFAPGRHWITHFGFRHEGSFVVCDEQYERYAK